MTKLTSSVKLPEVDYNTKLIIVAVIAVIALLFGLMCFFNEGFADKLFGSSNIKDLDVVVFVSQTCPYCVKLMDILKKENKINDVTIYDVQTKDGQEKAIMYGATKGLPTIISNKYHTGIVGLNHTSVKDIVKELSEVPSATVQAANKEKFDVSEESVESGPSSSGSSSSGPDSNDIQSLQIVLFHRDGCSWCSKAKTDIENSGLKPFIEMQDVNGPEGQNAMRDFNIEPGSGVPIFASRKTGKTSIGYKPMNQIVATLSDV